MMKCRMTVLALILTLKIIYTDSSQECSKNNYVIIDKNGDKLECLPCQSCNFGYGLTPPCGKELTQAQKANIDCVLCEPGKSYSDEHGPSSCKSCQICPVTLKNCTAESNTQCSRDCRKGYYYDNSTYNCQPCSYCCKRDNKRIAECAGLSAQLQCSVHDALECSPKTTKNPWPSSTNNGSTTDDKGINTVVIAVVIVVGVVVAVVVVILVLCLCIRRKPRHNDGREGEQLRFIPNTCGIAKSSFLLMANPADRAQEGKQLLLTCKIQGNTQLDNCFDNCIYEWKKDEMDYPCKRENIYFDPVQVKDFGRYTCKVMCEKHNQGSAEANLDLDVAPEPTKRYKNFTEIKLNEENRIADMLKSPPPGIGDWERVAEKYGMEECTRKATKGNDDRGMQVIDYIKASHTKLTVYEFCKFMKTIKQNQIVELLENHLTCENQERRQVNERDSGYCPEPNGQSSSSLHVPREGQNNHGLNDSRQGSRDELAGNSNHGKENRSDRKFDRQFSNHESARSSGSAGSGSASNSLVRTAKEFVRQISQNSSYKKQENEDGNPC